MTLAELLSVYDGFRDARRQGGDVLPEMRIESVTRALRSWTG